MNLLRNIIWGLLAKIVSLFISPRKKNWIFGSNFGRTYGEGPKCLFEYVYVNHPEVECHYITRNKDVYKECRKKGLPCLYNYSFKAIIEIAKSDSVFFSHAGNDILYAYPNKKRKFYYLMHGQAFKKGLAAESIKYLCQRAGENPFKITWFKFLRYKFILSGTYLDCDWVSATSDYVAQYTKEVFAHWTEIKVLGSPRCDALFKEETRKSEFFDNLKGKFIISYMPTHRQYGKGNVSPTLFWDNLEFQGWLRENNAVVLIKQHPNMLKQMTDIKSNDVIIDITKNRLDAFCVIANTDVLISDYSSVWMDYLLLRRPLIHYFYDDFVDKDEGVFYDLREEPVGHVCQTEKELAEVIRKCKSNYLAMCPSEDNVHKYHKYLDGCSSRRHYQELMAKYK